MRQSSSRVSRLVAEQCEAAICPELGEKRKWLTRARNDVDDPELTYVVYQGSTHRLLQRKITERSFLRQPGLAQAFVDALALNHISRIVAPGGGVQAADRKDRIERKGPPEPPRAPHPGDRVAPGRQRERDARYGSFGWPRWIGAARRPLLRPCQAMFRWQPATVIQR